MSYKVDNAIIMAAGTASRFAPLSYERPKALIEVKGEVLIERQIKQLREAGINEIILVVGYMKESFEYLKEKFGVKIVENNEYLTRNNNGSIYAAREYLKNTYICSSDNYFSKNPFEAEVDDSYYAAVYADGDTKEWCMTEDSEGYIPARKDGKWGFITLEDKIAIPFEYDHANEFKDGKARVWLGDECFYIDKDGNRLECEEDDDLPF